MSQSRRRQAQTRLPAWIRMKMCAACVVSDSLGAVACYEGSFTTIVPLTWIEYGVYGDLIIIDPKAIIYLLNGDYRNCPTDFG